ncbi:MAG: hypothetical protein IH599_03725, partial [Bacteroidales bacterium]|nr:hypothetical protein [Bacteroidales bacterium]
MTIQWKDIHHGVFLGGTFLLAIGIPTSHFLMSVGGLALSANWLLEGDHRRKLTVLFRDRAALIFLSIYLMHAVGMLYTSDVTFGLKDLRIKLPFLALPIIFATSRPFKTKEIHILLLAFVSAVTFGSLRSVYELLTAQVTDVRMISVYISHIRFALSVCLAIFILGYSVYHRWFPGRTSVLLQGLLMLWLSVFLLLLQSFTGLMVMGTTGIVLLLWYGWRNQRRNVRLAMLGAGILLPLITGAYVYKVVGVMHTPRPIDLSALEERTASGTLYHHDTLNRQTVNGHYIWIYLAEDEL